MTDEEIRMYALDIAINNTNAQNNIATILQLARIVEVYLKTGKITQDGVRDAREV